MPDIEYDPSVTVLKWPKAEGENPENRNWAFVVSPHQKGHLTITIPQYAYAVVPMSEDELAILMVTLEHLPGVVALMVGLAPKRES